MARIIRPLGRVSAPALQRFADKYPLDVTVRQLDVGPWIQQDATDPLTTVAVTILRADGVSVGGTDLQSSSPSYAVSGLSTIVTVTLSGGLAGVDYVMQFTCSTARPRVQVYPVGLYVAAVIPSAEPVA